MSRTSSPTARAVALAALVLALPSTPCLAWKTSSTDHLFQAPPVATLGATDVDVYPNGYQVVGGPFVGASGRGTDDTAIT